MLYQPCEIISFESDAFQQTRGPGSVHGFHQADQDSVIVIQDSLHGRAVAFYSPSVHVVPGVLAAFATEHLVRPAM